MALKFLNKKGWHTGSLRNIENVWKAEQKHEAEQKKLDELRKQIVEERERSEFRLLQEQAGLVPRQERLEFLYDSGLAVGRPGGSDSFKTLEALPKTEEAPSSSAASKQASASVPGALFEEKPQSANDAWRKLHSDPLLMIRQREQEALSRIKNNPVQMAMIRKSVEAKEPAEKLHEKKEHQKKQHHTGASKHSKHSSSIQTSDSGNDTAEVERRKSGHRQISKYVKHSDSEDESCKRARRRENTVKHSDSEDESRIRSHRSGKNPVKHSDSEDEFRYRTRRSEKNHVKHSDLENESHNRARRSGKNPVHHSDSKDESHYRARRSEKNHVKHSDLEDESHNTARQSGKNPVNHSDSEDELRYRARRSEKNHVKHSGSEDVSRNRAHRSGKNPVKHSDSEDETRYRAQRSEKNHIKHSDSEDESCKRLGRSGKNLVKRSHLEDESRNRARRGGKNQSIKIGRDDDQGDAKGKHDNLELEKYPMKGRNESHYKRRNVAPKLSEEERAARLKEMQIDAELHEEQRWKRLKKAEENDALETTQAVKSSGRNFLDAVQTSVYGAERGGSSTIEESVRRRTHYLQGRSEASERNAFRR
ncbi:PREDICTED: pre-mRNA-splicing factor CWC25 [Prunus dulcis]|uniref:PREDICTED: pre-mRNA-splicing factor CWC25 n=1 Tax=Prunus dulcis TaxID=3755 RepID=A0A5E4GCY0_PRUDU|nr:pre-mRNA-splicing factor CWC25 homolog isoform X2 [Prunus dulcis]VVA37452.1 PREDICTED: pre-mRNA-splicing factor CWC25 [Prunus dulcis]